MYRVWFLTGQRHGLLLLVCFLLHENQSNPFSPSFPQDFINGLLYRIKGLRKMSGPLKKWSKIKWNNRDNMEPLIFPPPINCLDACMCASYVCGTLSASPPGSASAEHQSSRVLNGFFYYYYLTYGLLLHFVSNPHTNNAHQITAVLTIPQTDCVFLSRTVHFQLPIYVHTFLLWQQCCMWK